MALISTEPQTEPMRTGTTLPVGVDLQMYQSAVSCCGTAAGFQEGGDSGSLSEDQTGRNGKRSGLFPNASQEKFLAVENTGVPAHASGQEEEDWGFGGKREELQPLSAAWERNAPSALAPGTSAAWERNAPSALAPETSVKEGDGAELPPPRPKFPPDSEELGSPTVPKLGGEKSPPPPPPSETPFPPGFDAASFLQWISSSLGLPQASSSSRQPRDVDGAVASTSRAGVVGSGESIQVLKWKSVRRKEKSPFLTLTKTLLCSPVQHAGRTAFFMENWESTPVQFVQPVTNISGEDRAKVVDDEVHSMLEKEQEVIGTRQLASVMGLLESTKQAILPRPLHFRALQQLLNFGIKKPGEFRLFSQSNPRCSKRSTVVDRVFVPSNLTICTDASLEGWGAHCYGQETGGRWSQTEARMHCDQLTRIESGLPGAKKLCERRYSACSAKAGQRNSRCICESRGGNKVARFGSLGPGDVVVGPGKRPDVVCNSRSQIDKHPSGQVFAVFFWTSLVFKVLRKVQSDVAIVILIPPVWKSQAWYPKVLNMLFESPVLLPQSWDLLFLPHNRRPHPLLPDLMLAAWPRSGDSCRVGAFRQGLQTSSSRLGEKALLDSISQHGLSGPAGVIEGRLIQFAAL
ncbi:hypothetical protein Bbelb_349450 [Branchiostoma belcheri]|nr:hypothetical protein Bbelb_349450 [Branchiostoma belcheri]